YWHVTLLTAFVVFVPLQVKLARGAITTLAQAGAPGAAGAIGLGVLLVVAYMALAAKLAKPMGSYSSREATRSAYAESVVWQHLTRVYKCLWREAGPGAGKGFPVSEATLRALGPDCWDPAVAPGGSAYGTHYDFRYLPGPPDPDGRVRSFGLATRKRTAPGHFTQSFYLDQLGILRRSVRDWATQETDRIE